jgi:hypothetical protein
MVVGRTYSSTSRLSNDPGSRSSMKANMSWSMSLRAEKAWKRREYAWLVGKSRRLAPEWCLRRTDRERQLPTPKVFADRAMANWRIASRVVLLGSDTRVSRSRGVPPRLILRLHHRHVIGRLEDESPYWEGLPLVVVGYKISHLSGHQIDFELRNAPLTHCPPLKV